MKKNYSSSMIVFSEDDVKIIDDFDVPFDQVDDVKCLGNGESTGAMMSSSLAKMSIGTSSGDALFNQTKVKSNWFEEEQNDFHHFGISFYPDGNRVFYTGEKVEVHLKVNVKKLQCLVATFECISTSHDSKSHSLDKNRIYSQDIRLYPTDKDTHLKDRSNRASLPPVLSPVISLKDEDIQFNNNNNNNNNNFLKETTVINNDLVESNSSFFRKSMSSGDYFSFNQWYDDSDECQFLEPLPESQVDSIYQPPIVHSCSEHQVLNHRKHKFIFRFKIPSNLPPSMIMQKDSKCGVFYRLFISGLGELHQGSKITNGDKLMIKGIQTSVPFTVQTRNLLYLPKELMSLPLETVSCQSNQIHLKARLLFKNYSVLGSNVSVYISIDNQSNQAIKGFKLLFVNLQKCFVFGNNTELFENSDQVWMNLSNKDLTTLHSSSTFVGANSFTSPTHNGANLTDSSLKKSKSKESNLNQPEYEQDNSSNIIGKLQSNIISTQKLKSTDKYIIQPKTKFVDTISFSIPTNITPSIYLPNLLNTYIFKFSITKKLNCFVELPILILPSEPI